MGQYCIDRFLSKYVYYSIVEDVVTEPLRTLHCCRLLRSNRKSHNLGSLVLEWGKPFDYNFS